MSDWVQKKLLVADNDADGTVTVSFDAPATAGNFILVKIGAVSGGGASTFTVTDNKSGGSNTYNNATGTRPSPLLSGIYVQQFFYAYNVGAATTITVAGSQTGTYYRIEIVEYASTVVDCTADPFLHGVAATGTSTTPSSGNITESVAALWEGAATLANGSETATPGTGWNSQGTDSGALPACFSQRLEAGGNTLAANFTTGGFSVSWVASAATFKSAVAPGAPAISWTTNAAGTQLIGTTSVSGCTLVGNQTNVTLHGTVATAASASLSGTTLTVGLTGIVNKIDTVTIDLPSNFIKDGSNTPSDAVTGGAVTNASTVIYVPASTTITLAADITDFTSITGANQTNAILDGGGHQIINTSLSHNVTISGLRLRNFGLPAPLTSTTQKTITGATNASPIVLAAASHGFVDGNVLLVAGVAGNTAANGVRYAKATGQDANHVALYSDSTLTTPVAGNGAYTSGGTAKVVELESFTESNGLLAIYLIGTTGITITVEDCTFDACAPMKIQTSGASLSIQRNTNLANLLRFQSPITDATFGMVAAGLTRSPWLIIADGAGATKNFKDNTVLAGPVEFDNGSTGMTVSGNVCYGDRCGLFHSNGTGTIELNVFWNINSYASFPTNIYGSQVSNLTLLGFTGETRYNVLFGAEWIIQRAGGRVHHNWFGNLQSHNWITGLDANCEVDHNIFLYNLGPANVGLLEGIRNYVANIGQSFHHNTCLGNSEFHAPVLGLGTGTVLYEHSNIYLGFYTDETGRKAIIACVSGETLPVPAGTEKRFANGSGYSLFRNPDADPATTNRGGLKCEDGSDPVGDVNADPLLTGPLPSVMPYTTTDFINRTVTVTQALAYITAICTPTASSPAKGAGKDGTDIGAVAAVATTPITVSSATIASDGNAVTVTFDTHSGGFLHSPTSSGGQSRPTGFTLKRNGVAEACTTAITSHTIVEISGANGPFLSTDTVTFSITSSDLTDDNADTTADVANHAVTNNSTLTASSGTRALRVGRRGVAVGASALLCVGGE